MKSKLSSIGRLVFLLWCGIFPFLSFAQQIPNSVTAPNGTFIGFYEYKPVSYSAEPTRKYPLIIFLHGIGERGNGTTELPRVLANAIPKYINAGHTMTFTYNGQTETFMVISPQLSSMYGSWQNFYVDEMIKYAKNNLRVDTNRIYLTGLSLGGGGTWKYASGSYSNARQLAAIAPVCGTCEWGNMCTSIAAAALPVWAFHAQDDGIVGVGCTTGAVSMINSCGPSVAPLMSIYPNGNHFIWDRSYDTTHTWHNPNMYEWFLSHSRSGTAPAPNTPPIARAGNDQSITLPSNSVTLDGSASTDPDGSISSYNWTKIGGPSQFSIASPNSASTFIGNLAQGVYSFQLTVTDNRGASARDTVLVTVNGSAPAPNQPPVAIAGADVAITLPTNNTYLFGSASYDVDGILTNYTWSQVSGPATATITSMGATNINASNLVQGVYAFRLLVTDNMGATDDDTLTVSVSSPNNPPVANAGSDQSIQLPANSVSLNGSGSSDPDGSVTAYAWTKVSGPAQYNITNSNSANTTVTNLAAGTYSFRLLVTDNNGATDDDTVVVTVSTAPPPPNVAPTANAGTDLSIQLPASSVTLNGSGSSDPDGSITAYAWTKIAGPAQYNITSAGSETTSVSNLVAGTYSFRLVVTDNAGATDDDTVTVTVAPAPNMPPTANAGGDQSIQLPSASVTLNGSASSDADGSITGYAWSKISGPAQYNIANASGVSTSVTNLVAGTYEFRLVVTDNNGATDDDTVMVTVSTAPPPPNIAPVANAGADQSVQLPANSVALDGSSSSDADGNITAYAWSKISGPAQYNITNANSSGTSVNNLTAGTYAFRLVVTDNQGATDDDTVVITVSSAPPPPNVAPVANAGSDQSIQLPANMVTLDGSASADPDGTITSYSWSIVSGPVQYNITNAGSVSTPVTGLEQGTYAFRLIVTDNAGATDDDTVIVQVTAAPPPPNQLPVARAGNDITIYLPSSSATLDGSASFDPDGSITAYMWNRISGPAGITIVNSTTATADVVGMAAGEYVFELTVTDNRGATSTDRVTITVTTIPNIPPLAIAGNDTTIAIPSTTAWLRGNASRDPDGTITRYQWRQISGPAVSRIQYGTANATMVNSLQVGEYEYELTVTDNKGASASDSVHISVVNNFRYEEVLLIYPNPVLAKATVRVVSDSTGDLTFRIIDMEGRLIKNIQSFKGQSYFEQSYMLSDLRPGTYYLEAVIGNGKKMIKKFIKQ
ncbi:MAG TPA: PKD domain-containing protein [Chitinophagaceae bacterium]